MLDRRTSDACRELVYNLCILADKKPSILFDRMFGELEKSRLSRIMRHREFDDQDEQSAESKNWRLEEAALLASIVSDLRQCDRGEILDHLLDPSVTRNSDLVKLIRTRYFRETRHTLPQLDRILQNHMAGARKIVACQYLIAARHQSDDLVPADVRRQQEEQNFGTATFDAKVKFQEGCREKFENGYDFRHTDTTIGQFHSGMEELRNCRGRFRFAKPWASAETQEYFAWDAIDGLNHKMFEITDDPCVLSGEQAQWVTTFEVVVAADDNFLMKILKGGLRIFLKRTGDRQRDAILDRELKLLYQLLSKPYVMHDLDKRSMVDHWTNSAAQIRWREEEILRINQEKQENEHELRPKRLWLPD